MGLQPELGEHREAIIQHLVKFTEEHLRPRLLGSCFLPCVLDLVILQQGGLHQVFDPHGEIRVVELNPANERTSAALFSTDEVLTWVKGEDALQEFRLVEKSELPNSRLHKKRSMRHMGAGRRGSCSEMHSERCSMGACTEKLCTVRSSSQLGQSQENIPHVVDAMSHHV